MRFHGAVSVLIVKTFASLTGGKGVFVPVYIGLQGICYLAGPMKYNTLQARGLFFLVSVIVLLWPALFNAFPLVTPDTGTYINSGMTLTVQADRSIGYGAFLLLTSMGISLWFVVLAQAILLNWLIRSVCRLLLGDKANNLLLLFVIILMGFTTTVSWFGGQLMPDAFTGMLLLALLLFFPEKDRRKQWGYGIFIFIACLMHNSHVPVLLLVSVLLMLYYYRSKLQAAFRAMRKVFFITVGAGVLLCFINLWSGWGFGLSPSSHVFIMSRMAENGILDMYLDKQCPVKHYDLCNYQGKLGLRQWDFMWGGDYPHNKAGWNDKATKKEYQQIIWGTLTTPKLLGFHILKAAEGTLHELPLIYVSDGILPQGEGTSPYMAIAQHFPHQLKEYHCTLQSDNVLTTPVQYVNMFIAAFAVLSVMAVLWLAQRKPEREETRPVAWKTVFSITILFLLVNAFITTTFSTVVPRFEARVFWVLLLLCLLYIIDYVQGRKQEKGSTSV